MMLNPASQFDIVVVLSWRPRENTIFTAWFFAFFILKAKVPPQANEGCWVAGSLGQRAMAPSWDYYHQKVIITVVSKDSRGIMTPIRLRYSLNALYLIPY